MGKKKVMVAADDPGIVDAITIMLEDAGYEATSTSDGITVKDIYKDLPDLLLLDIWMSGWDGKDTCKYLKSQDNTKNLPIVIISANKDTEAIAREAGADDFLAKPFQMEDLLAMVKKYTERN